MSRCSECGFDLTAPRAISRGTFTKQPRLIAAGATIIAIPWVIGAMQSLRREAGPHWERLRSNASIIRAIAADPTWEWFELTRRLNSGSLDSNQASAAVDELAKSLQSDPKAWRYHLFALASQFLQAADQKGDVGNATFSKIAQSYFADTPNVSVGPVHSDLPAFCSIAGTSDWPGATYHPEYAIRDAWLDEPSSLVTTSPAATTSASAEKTRIHLRDDPEPWIKRTDLPPGEYQLKLEFDVAAVAGPWRGAKPAPPGQVHVFPGARAQWTTTVTTPLEVLPPAEPPYKLRLEDREQLDPKLTGSVSVTSVEATCFTDETIIIVHTAMNHLAVNCCFDPFIVVSGREYPGLGQARFWLPNPAMTDLFSCTLGPLPADVRTVDLDLRPNSAMATQGKLPSIWGNSIRFLNLPIHRREYPWNQPKARGGPTTH